MKKNHFPPQNIQESVYATAAFFDVFDRPVMRREFFEFFLGPPVRQEDIDAFLEADRKLGTRNNFYYLPERENLLQVREVRDAVSEKYWKRVWKYLPKLQAVPFIRAVAVCNTLALDNCSFDSDIDFFIITKKDRIFTARVLSGLLFHLLGVRRHGEKISGRFCLSFYVSEDGMDLGGTRLKPEDPYLYYWMRSLEFAYRANDTIYRRFFNHNAWFTDHLPYGPGDRGKSGRNAFYSSLGTMMEFFFGGFWGNLLERWLEKRHMKRHEKNKKRLGPESDVVVEKKMLKFHNIDRRKEYNEKFFERYASLL